MTGGHYVFSKVDFVLFACSNLLWTQLTPFYCHREGKNPAYLPKLHLVPHFGSVIDLSAPHTERPGPGTGQLY